MIAEKATMIDKDDNKDVHPVRTGQGAAVFAHLAAIAFPDWRSTVQKTLRRALTYLSGIEHDKITTSLAYGHETIRRSPS